MLTSVTVGTATASASASGFVPAAAVPFVIPAFVDMFIDGVLICVLGSAALQIANYLGKTWDETEEGWNRMMEDTGKAVTKLLKTKEWASVDSDQGKAALLAVYESCTDAGGAASGGKKTDDKWYFEARKNHGELEINLKRMDEKDAVKEMKRGKNIMTVGKEQAQKVVGRFKGLSEGEAKLLKFEEPHQDGYFEHLHYEAKNMRLHCWVWKP